MKTDKKIKSLKSNWKFDKIVAENFDSHVTKSVPFYKISHDISCRLSDFFLREKSNCYDIGCSTGNLLKKISTRSNKKIKYYGIDSSKDMIKVAKKNHPKLNFINKDLNRIKLKKSDLVLSLYTMQFIEPRYRQELISKIYKSLNWGGGLILFEKIRGSDARFQDILNFLYFDFKAENGLKPSEIINKELSLRSVMEPFTIKANLDLLKRAGFVDVMPITQYLNFVGFLAIK
jgi:tRNA (cmo5U34)-methyltransferase